MALGTSSAGGGVAGGAGGTGDMTMGGGSGGSGGCHPPMCLSGGESMGMYTYSHRSDKEIIFA